ncbi:hypothetical protein D9M71_422740 [compost metagenome]
MAVATGLEADGVDGAVHFRFTQQGGDLFVQWGVLGQVGDFETLGLGVGQAHRVDVTDDHHRSTEQARRGGSSQADRAGTGDVHRAARAYAGSHGTVVTGRENVGEAGQVADFLHGLVAVRQFQQVEVGIRHQHVFSLATGPVAHVHIAVGATGTGRVDGQANAGVLFLARTAAAASNVERH